MAEQVTLSIYGSPRDPDWERKNEERLFTYLSALIKAEELNPESDYDSERYNELMKKIAVSNLQSYHRISLVDLLNGKEENEHDTYD